MAALNTDLFKKGARRLVTQIGSGGVADNSTTTVPLSSTTNMPTDTAVVAVIDRVDANGVPTPNLEETVIGVVSGTNLVSCVRGAEGTAQAHDGGAVVEILFTSKSWNDLINGLLDGHTQLGYHKALKDANGNTWIGQTALANAVNYLLVGNSITASNVTACMAGGDSNIGYDFRVKGTGGYRVPRIIEVPVGSSGGNLATGDGQGFFRVPLDMSGMNLTRVAAQLYVAGTTNTHDIQIHRTRAGSSADMLSTKITIDSTEVDTSTAATPAVINASNDDVITGDLIAIDIDAVSTTPGKGLIVEMRFELP